MGLLFPSAGDRAMTAEVLSRLSGRDAGLVTGLTWLHADAIPADIVGTTSSGDTMAQSLAVLAAAADLDFVLVPAGESWAHEAADALHEAGVQVLWAVTGALGRVAVGEGWIETLRMSAARPEILSRALDDTVGDAIADFESGLAARADAFLLADDIAGADGPLLSPDFILDALVPGYGRLARLAADTDSALLFHSDGDIRLLMPSLARAGFAGVHLAGLSENRHVLCHAEARRLNLCVLGGIDAMSLNQGARRAGIRAAQLALRGDMAVCDDGGLASAAEFTSYVTALEAARSYFRAQTNP